MRGSELSAMSAVMAEFDTITQSPRYSEPPDTFPTILVFGTRLIDSHFFVAPLIAGRWSLVAGRCAASSCIGCDLTTNHLARPDDCIVAQTKLRRCLSW